MKAPDAPLVDCTREQIDEAAVWMTMLHSQDRNARTEQGFRRWLQAHPAHPLAFEQISIAHEVTAAIPLRPLPPADLWRRKEAEKARVLAMRPLVMAASVCLAIIAAVFAFFHANSSRNYSTEVGEQRALTLSDGTQVFLNTRSSIVVRYDKQRRAVELERGEAIFEVAKGEPDRPFIVTAGDRRITALGTAFLVRMAAPKRGIFPWVDHSADAEVAQLQVTLLNGKIAVSDTRGENNRAAGGFGERKPFRNLLLGPGQRLTFAGNLRPKVDTPNLGKATAWRAGRIEFDKVSLADAVAEMNRYNTLKLTVDRPEARNLVITGTFGTGAAESFARAMAAAYRLEVIEKPDEIILAGLPNLLSRPADRPLQVRPENDAATLSE